MRHSWAEVDEDLRLSVLDGPRRLMHRCRHCGLYRAFFMEHGTGGRSGYGIPNEGWAYTRPECPGKMTGWKIVKNGA